MKVLVAGGAGFIGSALIHQLLAHPDISVVNLDKLTYAANLKSLAAFDGEPRYRFEQADICDGAAVAKIFADHHPGAVINLAAESHVDRSIDGPDAFVQTNVIGTHVLLESARHYWPALEGDAKRDFRFLQVSTDEVFGDLPAGVQAREDAAYSPGSPYAASKAAADHLVHAWHRTYGLPVLLSNCTNNYGPRQFPEKLIPLMILNAFEGKPLPVYGDGAQVRDWLHVDDHARALVAILTRGQVGERYNVSAACEKANIDIVRSICRLVDQIEPLPDGRDRTSLIEYVPDRPGHDRRYALDASRLKAELGWDPTHNFESGLAETIRWYRANSDWWRDLRQSTYAGERLGLSVNSVSEVGG